MMALALSVLVLLHVVHATLAQHSADQGPEEWCNEEENEKSEVLVQRRATMTPKVHAVLDTQHAEASTAEAADKQTNYVQEARKGEDKHKKQVAKEKTKTQSYAKATDHDQQEAVHAVLNAEVTVETFSDASCTTPAKAHADVHKVIYRKVQGSACFQVEYFNLGEQGSGTKGWKLDGKGSVETYVATDCTGKYDKFPVAYLGLEWLELLRCPSGCVANSVGKYEKWSGTGFDPNTDETPNCAPASTVPFFQSTATADQYNLAHGTALRFDHTLLNSGDYDASTSRFRAPSAGMYFFGFTVLSVHSADNVEVHFWKNGKDYEVGCYDSTDSYTPCSGNTIMQLNAGDYVDIRTEGHHGGMDFYGSTTRGLTHFQGMKVATSVAFQAVASAKQNNLAADTALQFDQVLLNTGGYYDASKSRFKAPWAGLYYFSFTVLSGHSTDDVEVHFWKNGKDYEVGCYDNTDSYTPCSGSTIMYLNSFDYVDIRTDGHHGAMDFYGSTTRGLTHFQGMKVATSVAFQAVASAEQNNLAADTALQFDQVLLNTGGDYDASKSRFKAPSAGLYYFSFTVLSGHSTDDVEVHFWKNGKDYEVGCYDNTNSYTPCSGSTIMQLNAGDYVDIRTDGHHGAMDFYGSTTRGLTHFVGFLLADPQAPLYFEPGSPGAERAAAGIVGGAGR